ncbi:hypothetical protein M011DRAFT_320492 [Sporormia fimetaria CBS 119925]|uniref:Uncharacterized protein n=1 Tax=Sporormia fimetaria CBS 119925 TaxID=1340428 RepID=A0A6A6VIN5_9PLEO|nr:hypothetical protein M011DRAFT_320492 [Sporormia fimetaria CBS 119925]
MVADIIGESFHSTTRARGLLRPYDFWQHYLRPRLIIAVSSLCLRWWTSRVDLKDVRRQGGLNPEARWLRKADAVGEAAWVSGSTRQACCGRRTFSYCLLSSQNVFFSQKILAFGGLSTPCRSSSQCRDIDNVPFSDCNRVAPQSRKRTCKRQCRGGHRQGKSRAPCRFDVP